MNVTLKRDGLTLSGELLKPDVEKCPILIIFHGFMANIGKDDKSMFYQIAHECLNNGIATIRFDFDGHGDSDGEFCDMNVLSEILDAAKIIDYVRGLDFVTEINYPAVKYKGCRYQHLYSWHKQDQEHAPHR